MPTGMGATENIEKEICPDGFDKLRYKGINYNCKY